MGQFKKNHFVSFLSHFNGLRKYTHLKFFFQIKKPLYPLHIHPSSKVLSPSFDMFILKLLNTHINRGMAWHDGYLTEVSVESWKQV